jgi:hypothetical protein
VRIEGVRRGHDVEIRDGMRWDGMRWDEMGWDEMRWDEMGWDEMRWGDSVCRYRLIAGEKGGGGGYKVQSR